LWASIKNERLGPFNIAFRRVVLGVSFGEGVEEVGADFESG
jgi:hypothetical protein